MRFLRIGVLRYTVMAMREGAYPSRLTTEEGIAEVIRERELSEWRDTFRDSDKLASVALESNAREVADWRIDELREEHGSLTGAFHTDLILQDQLTVFENGNVFLERLSSN